MGDKLPPHFIDLVLDAALKSFWRKKALIQFLRRCHISEAFLATWRAEETKRDFLYRLFPKMESSAKGESAIKQMAVNLAEHTTFPDLEGWEDAVEKKQAAVAAINVLKAYLQKQKETSVDEKSRTE